MKTIFLLIVLTAAFLGGYYLGQQPDSPDIFGMAGKAYRQASDIGHQVSAAVGRTGSAECSRAEAFGTDVYRTARADVQKRQAGR